MKATILAGGALQVTPETELEAYALGHWCRVNFGDWFNAAQISMNVIVDLSGYPAANQAIGAVHHLQPGLRTQS
ncbi:hypothetical protein H0X90_21690 [Burkholderia sp. 9775_39]|uniref:hypothetical protein n=1 Tax=unclassified Burkholderia TaxID=2613784 RepID=UPI0018C438D4|nr:MULTISPECIES: hypothetical protein [unclassified Burkholderia]MBG0879406.1 hypothetical protein [Burkholderia sp. 9775_39]MBG0884547.1 hypothetical protein [Burkholderia sp. 9773_38]